MSREKIAPLYNDTFTMHPIRCKLFLSNTLALFILGIATNSPSHILSCAHPSGISIYSA